MRGRSRLNHGSTPQDWNGGEGMERESPYVLGANKRKNIRTKAWESQAYVIVSTFKR